MRSMTSTSIDLPGGPPSLENSAAVKAIEDIAFGSVSKPGLLRCLMAY